MVQLPSAPSESGNSRSGFGGALLRVQQHHAGLAGHGVGGGVDLADAVHPPQREHDFAVVRRLAADQAGVAALRHERGAVFVGELADRGDFRGRARPQHQRRVAVIQAALLGDIGRDVGGIGDGIFVADDRAEAGDQVGRSGGAAGWTMFIASSLASSSRLFRRRRGAAGR